jgi:hypothetical protein
VVPRRLSAEQRATLERFSETLTEENLRDPDADGSIFARVRRAFR